MTRLKFTSFLCAGAIAILGSSLLAQQRFQVLSDASQDTIAGRLVQLDAKGKLLPWPIGDNIGYSYSSHFLSQWEILKDQLDRTRLPYFYCCFDFDRTTFEAQPELHWVNSTGYLRAMMEGFVERLYPYTGDRSTVQVLQQFVDYELETASRPKTTYGPRYHIRQLIPDHADTRAGASTAKTTWSRMS